MIMNLSAPNPDEYAPFYAEYVQRATARGNVLAALRMQIDELHSALDPLNDAQARFRFGPKEWSIKEVSGHLADTERIFSYRLICVARNEHAPLPGFEQEEYVTAANFDECKLSDLLQEFELLRRANILALNNLSDDMLTRRGTASGASITVRALIYILVGHVDHHMESFRTNYFPKIK